MNALSPIGQHRTSKGPFDVEAVPALEHYAAFPDEGQYEGCLEVLAEDATYVAVARENVAHGRPPTTIRCESRAMRAHVIDAVTTTPFWARRLVRHIVTAIRPGGGHHSALGVTANSDVVETQVDEARRVFAASAYRNSVITTADSPRFVEKVAISDAPPVPTSLIAPLRGDDFDG